MAKCKYKYKNYPNKKCPHEAEPGSDFCKWHEPKDGKDFSGQKIKEKDLTEAYLVRAKLQEADLSSANLQGANLIYANLQKVDLHGSKLQEADLSSANLQGANLSGAEIQRGVLSNAKLQGADLWGSELEKADLSYANLYGADLSIANLKYANLYNTNLQIAKLHNANLQKVDLHGSKLQEADLSSANLQGANLWDSELEKADLSSANLQGANLWNAKLQEADLSYANLYRANLGYTKLQRANLSDAKLQEADLSYANLYGANLSNSDLTNVLFNNRIDLRAVILYIAETKTAKKLQYTEISGKNPGEMCIEELLADNIHNLFNNKETDFEKALNGVIKHNLNLLGFKRNKKIYIESKICSNIYIPDKGWLKEIFNEIFISQYDKSKIQLRLYEMAKDVYINLKNYFKNAGLYDESGNFFIGEYRVRGKIYEISAKQYCYVLKNRIKNFFRKFVLRNREKEMTYMPETKSLKLIGSIISNYFAFLTNRMLYVTSLYGESVWRIILTALSVIGFYAAIYWLSKGITYGTHSTPVHSFLTDLYFSIVTFTTLGYGDLHPVAHTWIRLVAGSEAFLGAFILAYFVVIVSRKIMR